MSIEVNVSDSFERWAEGFSHLERDLLDEAKETWRDATEYMFSASQDYVHVLSGQLKASGVASVDVDAGEVVGRVEYLADYAIYEHARGGSHAFLQLAYLDAQSTFENALAETWERTTGNWS